MGAARDHIEQLILAHRLEDAAAVAVSIGDHMLASKLLEQACDDSGAAEQALTAGDSRRAFQLATRGGDETLQLRVTTALVARPRELMLAAADARPRYPGAAARLYEAGGESSLAAECFEEAGNWGRAGACHLAAQNPRDAARCLERHLAELPTAHASRLLLGKLLLDHDRASPALKTLQGIAPTAPERREALPLLIAASRRLNLASGARELETEARAAGVDISHVDTAKDSTKEAVELLFGRYAVETEVARTPSARVLRAHDQLERQTVAVKLYSPSVASAAGRDALLRFAREAEALAQLRHPAIVPLVDYVPSGPAVVLRWMGGGSFEDVLRRGPLAPARSVEIVLAVLSALEVAHRQGILHRDIKPGNVLFDDAGAAFLSDFGAAHLSEGSSTVTAGLIGTFGYMAPEVRAGSPATIQSDLYGVGALLWHGLTGAPPEVGARAGDTRPFANPELRPEHEQLVRQLVAADPGERPGDATTARGLLLSVEFPREVPELSPAQAAPNSDGSAAQQRLQPRASGPHRDLLLQRDVSVIEVEDSAILERGRAWARAGDTRLACVYALTPGGRELWVEHLPTLPEQRQLDADERGNLRAALETLHRAGGCHGSVDRAHIGLRAGEPVLLFPRETRWLTPAEDTKALEAL